MAGKIVEWYGTVIRTLLRPQPWVMKVSFAEEAFSNIQQRALKWKYLSIINCRNITSAQSGKVSTVYQKISVKIFRNSPIKKLTVSSRLARTKEVALIILWPACQRKFSEILTENLCNSARFKKRIYRFSVKLRGFSVRFHWISSSTATTKYSVKLYCFLRSVFRCDLWRISKSEISEIIQQFLLFSLDCGSSLLGTAVECQGFL